MIEETPVCKVDVATDSGSKILAEKEIKIKDLVETEKIKLNLFLENDVSRIEFRVLSYGVISILVGVKPEISRIKNR
jgi:hypothetical protein